MTGVGCVRILESTVDKPIAGLLVVANHVPAVVRGRKHSARRTV
jgi:hypothetical protein